MLKLLGVIVLAIVIFVIAILILALLIPVQYRLCADNNDDMRVCIKSSWLLHVVYVKAEYKKENFVIKFRLFGLPIDRLIKLFKNKKSKSKSDTKQKKKHKEGKNSSISNNKEVTSTRNIAGKMKKDTENKKTSKALKQDSSSDENNNCYYESKWEKLKNNIHNFINKLYEIKDKIDDIKVFLERKSTKKGIKMLKYYVKRSLKCIAPRKTKIYVKFGCEKPDNTGKILGGISLIYTWYGANIDKNINKNVEILPEFEEKVLEYNAKVKGSVQLIQVLVVVIKILNDKDMKRLKRNFKKAIA